MELFIHQIFTVIIFLINLVQGYTRQILNDKETCHDKDRLDTENWYALDKCKNLCNKNRDCRYFYVSENHWCVTYKDCNEHRTTDSSGSTYKKLEDAVEICNYPHTIFF